MQELLVVFGAFFKESFTFVLVTEIGDFFNNAHYFICILNFRNLSFKSSCSQINQFISNIIVLCSVDNGAVAVAGSGVDSRSCLGTASGVGSDASSGVVFFSGNILLLKLLRIFSLALRNNYSLSRKDIFSPVFAPLFKLFNIANNFLFISMF